MEKIERFTTTDTIISFDIETTGFIAGVNSMISLGAVAFRDGENIGEFYACLKEFPGSRRDLETMKWWEQHRNKWREIKELQEEPKDVMIRFFDWGMTFKEERVLAANPACFDAAMMWWYLYRYAGKDAIQKLVKRHRALDIRTYIAAVFNKPYSKAERFYLPQAWADGTTITHNALDDARQQGYVLMNLMKANGGFLELS